MSRWGCSRSCVAFLGIKDHAFVPSADNLFRFLIFLRKGAFVGPPIARCFFQRETARLADAVVRRRQLCAFFRGQLFLFVWAEKKRCHLPYQQRLWRPPSSLPTAAPDFDAVILRALQILGEYGKEVLYLKKRMGFIKLALRNGVPLVPAYVFGASDTFRTSDFLRKTRLALVKNLR